MFGGVSVRECLDIVEGRVIRERIRTVDNRPEMHFLISDAERVLPVYPGGRGDREKLGGTFTDADVVRIRRTRAGLIFARFGNWIEVLRRCATPKSLFGQAIECSRNQRASLVRYLDDARFAIDNG